MTHQDALNLISAIGWTHWYLFWISVWLFCGQSALVDIKKNTDKPSNKK